MSSRYAICIWGELRGVKAMVDKFHENVLAPLNADVYVVCQRAFENDEEIVKLFEPRLKQCYLYEKPNLESYLGDAYKNIYNKIAKTVNNWIDNPAVTQQYVNFREIYNIYGQELENNYDYVIFMRSDLYFTYPFPKIHELTTNRELLWNLSTSDYDGVHYNLMCVPVSKINIYLNGAYNILQNSKLLEYIYNKYKFVQSYCYNSESFMKYMLDLNNLKCRTFDINAFITGNSLNERNTWDRKFVYDRNTKLYYKYEVQYVNAIKHMHLWNSGKRWAYIDNTTTQYITLQ